jgi:hypothetical protein
VRARASACEAINPRLRFQDSRARKNPARLPARAYRRGLRRVDSARLRHSPPTGFQLQRESVGFAKTLNPPYGQRSARTSRVSISRVLRFVDRCQWSGIAAPAPRRRPEQLHLGTASPAQRGALVRASRADGGGSAIIRSTLTPDPAPMEADGGRCVYQVSHVVDGESVNLLRRKHSDHYYIAARSSTASIFSAMKR